MVGDFLQNTNGNVGRVIGVRPYMGTAPSMKYDYEVVMQYHQTGTVFSDPKMLQPIPITPEILEKNGFVKDKLRSTSLSNVWAWSERTGNTYAGTVEITLYSQPICGVSILTKIDTKSKTGCGCDSVHSCDIDSVHELQHALRLCLINKEIAL